MKKIFVAVTNDISTDQRVHKICNYLLTLNYQVTVYGRTLPNTFEVTRNYKITRIKHWFNHNFLFYAEYNIRLFFRLLFSKKYNIILSNDLDTLPACFFASKLKRTKLVYDSHELFSESVELQGRNFTKGFWTFLERFFLPKIKYAYTVSQSIAEYYNHKYKTPFGIVRNVPFLHPNIEKKNVSFPTKNKVVLYQGVLNPGRGLKPMIKALHLLKNIDLVIIGYGKVETELKNFVQNEQLTDRVHFLGRIPHHELANYTKLASIGMVLEEPIGKSFEFSLPNKLFDYIHAELPIVAGNLPEIKKIILENNVGLITKDYQPESIATTITTLIKNEALYNQIKNNQKNVKNKFCWENEQKKLAFYFS